MEGIDAGWKRENKGGEPTKERGGGEVTAVPGLMQRTGMLYGVWPGMNSEEERRGSEGSALPASTPPEARASRGGLGRKTEGSVEEMEIVYGYLRTKPMRSNACGG